MGLFLWSWNVRSLHKYILLLEIAICFDAANCSNKNGKIFQIIFSLTYSTHNKVMHTIQP